MFSIEGMADARAFVAERACSERLHRCWCGQSGRRWSGEYDLEREKARDTSSAAPPHVTWSIPACS